MIISIIVCAMKIHKIKPGHRKLTQAKARLIGHLIGDGCVYKSVTNYNIKYDNMDYELLEMFMSDFFEVYGLIAKLGYKASGKTGRLMPFVKVRSIRAFKDLRKYCSYYSSEWNVPKQMFNTKRSIQREFLVALFDDEGSVIPIGKKAILRLYSINLTGLKQVQILLELFGISSNIVAGFGHKRNVFAITIKDVKLFKKKINFYCIRKQNNLARYVKEKRKSALPDLNRGPLDDYKTGCFSSYASRQSRTIPTVERSSHFS